MENSDPGDEQPFDPTSIGPMHGPLVGRGHGTGMLGLEHWIDGLDGPCQHPACATERAYWQAESAARLAWLREMLAA